MRTVPEFSLANYKYGNVRIIRDYCKWPADRMLPCVVPHGLGTMWFDMDRTLLKAVWVYNEQLGEGVKKDRLAPHHRTLGFPFIYLDVPNATPTYGTLFMPAYGLRICIRTEADFRSTLESILKIPEEFKPVTVCIHPMDNMYATLVESYGLRCVSCGVNDEDDDFMINMMHHMLSHRFVSADYNAVQMWLATYLKRPFFFCGRAVVRKQERGRMLDAFGEEPRQISDELTDRTNAMLGLKYKKTPEEMHEILRRWSQLEPHKKLQAAYEKHGLSICNELIS